MPTKRNFRLLSVIILLKIVVSLYHLSSSVVVHLTFASKMLSLSTLKDNVAPTEEMVSRNRELCELLEVTTAAAGGLVESPETKLNLARCRKTESMFAENLRMLNIQIEVKERDIERFRTSHRLLGENMLQSGIQFLFRILLAYSFYAKKRDILQRLFFIYPLAMYYLDWSLTEADTFSEDFATAHGKNNIVILEVVAAILYLPIGDHIFDHRILFSSLKGYTDLAVFVLFYAGHIYFFLLLKRFIDCLTEEEEWRPSTTTPQVKRGKIKKKQKENVKSVADTRSPDHSWFFHACLYGHRETIKSLLKNPNFDVNAKCANSDNNSGLHIAVLAGEVSAVQILLDNQHHRVDLLSQNEDGKSALELAVEMGRLDIVNKITSAKAFKWKHVDANKLLDLAVRNDRHQVAQRMLQSPKFDTSDTVLVSCIERWVELFEEGQRGDVSDSKRRDVEKSLSTYKKFICEKLSERLSASKPRVPSNKRVRQIVEDYFECPVCSEEMIGEGVKIFTCSNDHWICTGCLQDERLTSCPICREDFTMVKPMRCLPAERIASQICL